MSLQGLKAVFCFPALHFGGAERQGLHFCRYLRDFEGVEVEVWGFLEGDGVRERCAAWQIPCRLVPFKLGKNRAEIIFALWRLGYELRKTHADLILPYVDYPNLAVCSAWRWTKARFCWWQQRNAGFHRGPIWLRKKAVKTTPAFIANSTPGLDFLTSQLGLPKSRCHFIPNGIEDPQPLITRREWRDRLGLQNQDFLVTMVANLTATKDHSTLLKAWKQVLSNGLVGNPPVLALAGRFGDAEKEIKALAHDLELGKSVRFLGAVDDVDGLLSASDLCAFSSQAEGCPNGVLEAMAAGLPVVATDIPGVRDALGSNATQFLAPIGDPLVLAQKIQLMIDNPGLRQEQGKKNRARVKNEFSIEKMCQSSVGLIKAHIQQRNSK